MYTAISFGLRRRIKATRRSSNKSSRSMEAEVLNGFEDDDGCPDALPQEVIEFTGVIKGIRFKRGSARILRASYRTLDRPKRRGDPIWR